MITLKMQEEKNQDFMRIFKVDENLWQIEVGPWYESGQPWWPPEENFLTKEKILMKKNDLIQLAHEIKRVIKDKITEKIFLGLTFWKNKPQLRIRMRYVDKDYPLLSLASIGMFEFSPGINVKHLNRALGREEDQYLLEGKGSWNSLMQFYSPEELKKFADDIEKEANSN